MIVRLITAGVVLGALLSPALAESRSFEVGSFDQISVAAGISAVVDVGGPQSVRGEAPSNAILDHLLVQVIDSRLEIRFQSGVMDWVFNLGEDRNVLLHVSVPRLNSASASAGADLDVHGMAADLATLSASSGGAISADGAKLGFATLDASSGGTITIAGTCDTLAANASSGGTLAAKALVCSVVNANASVGGNITVTATTSINANASVGGNVSVSGKPTDISLNASTGGTARLAD
jgi:hypothetical protein